MHRQNLRSVFLLVTISSSRLLWADCTASGEAFMTDHGTMLNYHASGSGSCSATFALTSIYRRIDGSANRELLKTCNGVVSCETDNPLQEGKECYVEGDHTMTFEVDCRKPTPDGMGCVDDNTGTSTTTFHIEHRAKPSGTTLGPLEAGSYSFESKIDYSNVFRTHISVTGHYLPGKTFPGVADAGSWGVNPSDIATGARLGDYAGAEFVEVVAAACDTTGHDTAAIPQREKECCDCDQPAPCVGRPIRVSNGNMRYSDLDPIPLFRSGFARVYDSAGTDTGVFGTGWMSIFDSWLRTMHFDVDNSDSVVIGTPDNHRFVFHRSSPSNAFQQLWPQGSLPAELTYLSGTGEYVFRDNGSSTTLWFSSGHLVKTHDLTTGRFMTIAYTGDLPTSVSDSWGNVSLTIAADATLTARVGTITVSGGSIWTYQYDAAGQLTTVLVGSDTWRTYEYASGRLKKALDGAAHSIEEHTYDAAGNAITSTGGDDEVAAISYGNAGRVTGETITEVTMLAGAVNQYYTRYVGGRPRTVEVKGLCTGCGARDGVYGYDINGRITIEQNARGYITTRAFDSNGRVVQKSGPWQPASCDPATATDHCRLTPDLLATTTLSATPQLLTTTYAYADSIWPDRVTQTTSTSVRGSIYTRSVTRTLDATTGQVLTAIETGWTGTNNLASPDQFTQTNLDQSESHTTTTILYNGTEVAAFNPGGNFDSAWLLLAQPGGMRKSVDGPRTDVTDVTTFVYYPLDSSVQSTLRGHLAAVKNAAGHITRFEDYDLFGTARRVIDPNGVVTEATYDTLGRLLTSTLKGISGCSTSLDALCGTDLTTTRAYDPVTGSLKTGPLKSVQHPRGNVVVYDYDTRGRVTATSVGASTTDLRERLETDYDPASGRKSQERMLVYENPSWVEKHRESFTYDSFGRLNKITHADDSKAMYQYNVASSLSSVQDENHTTPNTTNTYDAAERLKSVTQKLATATNGEISTAYDYDVAGNLTAVTDANGAVTRYIYDDFGRLISQVSPVTGVTSYAYDAAANLTSSKDANGAVTTRAYDVLSRVTSSVATLSGSTESISFSYDDPTAGAFGLGRLHHVVDALGSTTPAYDRRGLLLSENRTISPVPLPWPLSYSYDANGNRQSIGGTVYTHDFADRESTVSAGSTPIISSSKYLPFGPLTEMVYGNGLTMQLTYNARYQPSENKLFNTSSNAAIADYAYGADSVGNISYIHDSLVPGYNRDFTYDDLNRLITANTGASLWGTGTYEYDSVGNMRHRSLGTAPVDDSGGSLSVPRKRGRPTNAAVSGYVDRLDFTYVDNTSRLNTVASNGLEHTVTYDNAGNETQYYVSRTYTPRNLLSSVIDSSEGGSPAGHIDYGYDWRGVRFARSEYPAGPGRNYFYDQQLHLINVTGDFSQDTWSIRAPQENYALPPLRNEFIWFDGRPVSEFGPARTASTMQPLGFRLPRREAYAIERFFTFTDHLGTPILQTNAAGEVVWRVEYEPFGNVYAMRRDSNGNDLGYRTDQPLRFPGQDVAMSWEGAEESYNVFRWYKSVWGRYTQADPIANLGMARLLRQMVEDAPSADLSNLSWYSYAADNPLSYEDPLGLKVKNNTNCRIYIKEESTGKVHPVYPGQEWPGEQDGYADPCKFPNQVFKTVDKVDIDVGGDGQPSTSGGGIAGAIGQVFKGGWKDKHWQKKLQKKGDTGWDDLFKKSDPKKCLCCGSK